LLHEARDAIEMVSPTFDFELLGKFLGSLGSYRPEGTLEAMGDAFQPTGIAIMKRRAQRRQLARVLGQEDFHLLLQQFVIPAPRYRRCREVKRRGHRSLR
jgi:hypothetical protein